jgi:FKBP-type peptidyl-prolyl cis-trans isomerase
MNTGVAAVNSRKTRMIRHVWGVGVFCILAVLGSHGIAAEPEPAAASEKEIAGWIANLGSEDFTTREQAQTLLAQAGRAALPALQKVLENTKDAEVKQRATELVQKMKDKDGWVTLPSGVKYKVLTEGKGGGPPGATDIVSTHYVGTLLDGTEFDNSRSRGEPTQLPVNGVIAGWSEVLQLMPVGSKWKVHIPPEKGYGAQGVHGTIPPNATLIFEIELLAVEGR